jgi:hypothetical protein
VSVFPEDLPRPLKTTSNNVLGRHSWAADLIAPWWLAGDFAEIRGTHHELGSVAGHVPVRSTSDGLRGYSAAGPVLAVQLRHQGTINSRGGIQIRGKCCEMLLQLMDLMCESQR